MNQNNMILQSVRTSIEVLNKILVDKSDELDEDKVIEIKGKIKELEEYRNGLLESIDYY